LTLSVIILVTTIYVRSPLEFAALPSILLAITLFRLVLNVATTRLILSGGGINRAPDVYVAGEVVHAFSNFVTANSVTVGAIIFLIIFVIQFVVITKGGSRISEVAARFMLDAMPGKQMAIDAELNSGGITREEAHRRREEVSREADFYAAMDGAGRFVRGDAIACVVITIVNILGGLYIGMFEKQMQPLDCLAIYTKLTIGDGLVSQIPAFVVSLGAGLIVTRTSSQSNLGDEVLEQMLARPKALLVACLFLALLAFTGLPKLPLAILGVCCGGLAYIMTSRPSVDEESPEETATGKAEPEVVEKLLDLDAIEVELGHGLIRLTDASRGGDLLDRLSNIRRQIALELGLVVPAVRISDNPLLGVNDYAIKLRGQQVARGVTYPEQFLAVDEGEASGAIVGGEETSDPASGRLSYWITESQGTEADHRRYRVLEASQVLVNHLAEIIRAHAAELLTRQAVKNLLDHLRAHAAAVVDEVIPQQIKPGELQKVLQNLLRERVPIRDLETILETLGDHAAHAKDIDLLTEYVRVALGRTICKQHVDDTDRLACLVLSSTIEQLVAGHLEQGERGTIHTMPPATSQRIAQEVADLAFRHAAAGRLPVMLCAPQVRGAVRKLIEPVAPQIAVLSLAEVSGDVAPDVVGVVGEEASGQQGAPGEKLIEEGYESSNV
jgi:flagellar biosynthesis protein FlhA